MDQRLTKALADLRHVWAGMHGDGPALAGLLERFDRLSLLVTYQGFDLEATRRENAALRRAVQQSRHRRH